MISLYLLKRANMFTMETLEYRNFIWLFLIWWFSSIKSLSSTFCQPSYGKNFYKKDKLKEENVLHVKSISYGTNPNIRLEFNHSQKFDFF